MFNKKKVLNFKTLVLSIIALASLGTVAFTTVSCGGISSKILDNQIDKKDGENFADGYDLKTQIKKALDNPTYNNAFAKNAVDNILYIWYNYYAFQKLNNPDSPNNKIDQIVSFRDRWEQWYEDYNTEYDDKVSQYKTDYKDNWKWYFQNEVLEISYAFGGSWYFNKAGKFENNISQKQHYIKNQMMSAIRSEFPNLVFSKNYFGLPIKNNVDSASPQDLSYSSPNYVTFNGLHTLGYNPKIKTVSPTNNLVNQLAGIPGAWQYLDYYADVDRSTTIESQILSASYAYIQHAAFENYYSYNLPFSTAMSLWKNSEASTIPGGWKTIYNEDVVPADNQKTGWEFPWFEDVGAAGPKHGPNEYFKDFMIDGFGNGASFNFDLPFVSTYDTSDAGLIEIPIADDNKYTEDSATLFKVNLGSDMFTTTFIPYAAVVADFVNGAKTSPLTSTSLDLKPVGSTTSLLPISTTPASLTATDYPLFKNFVFKESFTPSSINTLHLGTDLLLQDNGGNKYEVFAHDSEFYNDSYSKVTSGYVMGDGTLPIALIKERGSDDGSGSGIHFIALDGYNYLKNTTDTWDSFDLPTYENIYTRNKDLIKFRCFQNIFGTENKTGGSIDFTGDPIKEYFTTNINRMVLDLFNPNTNTYNDAYFNQYPIFDLDQWCTYDSNLASVLGYNDNDKWTSLFDVAVAIEQHNIFVAKAQSVEEVSKKLFDFNKTPKEKTIWRASTSSTTVVDDGIYQNGIGGNFPFSYDSIASISIFSGAQCFAPNTRGFKVQAVLADSYQGDVSDFWIPTIGSSVVDFSKTLADYADNIFAKFDVWYDKWSVGSNWSAVKGIGYNKYSEKIYANAQEANDLLNTIATNDVFVNSVYSSFYKNYLGKNNFFSQSNLDNNNLLIESGSLPFTLTGSAPSDLSTQLFKAMQQKYYKSGLNQDNILVNDPTIYANPTSYLDAAYDNWKFINERNVKNVNTVSHLDTLKYLSNLKYLLTGGKSGKEESNAFNPYQFINWMYKKIAFGDKAVLAMTTKNYRGYNTAFDGLTGGSSTNISTATPFEWTQNYNNYLYDKYAGASSTSSAYGDTTTTHATNSNYYSLIDIGGTKYPGYLGLLVNGGSETGINNYFDNFLLTYGNAPVSGALNHFNALAPTANPHVDVSNIDLNNPLNRYTLFGEIAYRQYDMSAIKSLSADLAKTIPNFNDINDKIQTEISLYCSDDGNNISGKDSLGQAISVTSQIQAQGLIDLLYNYSSPYNNGGGAGTYVINPNLVYGGSANSTGSTLSTFFATPASATAATGWEVLPKANSTSALYKDGDTYSAYAFSQFNYIDLLEPGTLKEVDDSNAVTIFNNLVTKYGNAIYLMLIDAMNDSSITSVVEPLIIYNDVKIDNVYDRRFNNLLGKKWLKNYKEGN